MLSHEPGHFKAKEDYIEVVFEEKIILPSFEAYALTSNTTGNNNTALAYSADVGYSNIKNAIVIGYNASVNATNNMSFGNTNVAAWYFG